MDVTICDKCGEYTPFSKSEIVQICWGCSTNMLSKLDSIIFQIEWAKENGMKSSENVGSDDIEWLIEQAKEAEMLRMEKQIVREFKESNY
jgi:hypothetical protein